MNRQTYDKYGTLVARYSDFKLLDAILDFMQDKQVYINTKIFGLNYHYKDCKTLDLTGQYYTPIYFESVKIGKEIVGTDTFYAPCCCIGRRVRRGHDLIHSKFAKTN